MQPMIEIDDDVLEMLKAKAEPLVDTPSSVLRRVLGLEPDSDEANVERRVTPTRAPTRAPYGSILPESEYEIPILRYLDEHGGRAPSRDVVRAVGEELGDRLTELDYLPLKAGDIRWENRVAFTRLRLVERGELKDDSPRGTWEITQKGRERLNPGP